MKPLKPNGAVDNKEYPIMAGPEPPPDAYTRGVGVSRAPWELPQPEAGAKVRGGSVRIIELPKVTDQRGNLTFIEGNRHVPFPIRRVYYLYDVPAGALRGGHAHRKLEQFVVAASGSFTVVVDDGRRRRKFFLNRPHYGLYVPQMTWRALEDFSSGSICVVLASEEYDESDYYRDYGQFKAALRKKLPHSLPGSARRVSGAQNGDRRGGGSGPG